MAGSLGFEPRTTLVSKTSDFTSLSKTQLAPHSGVGPEFQPSQGCVLSIVLTRYGTNRGTRTHIYGFEGHFPIHWRGWYWWTSEGIEPSPSECKTDVLPLSLAAHCNLFYHGVKW